MLISNQIKESTDMCSFWNRFRFPFMISLFQAAVIVLFIIFCVYTPLADKYDPDTLANKAANDAASDSELEGRYMMFQDVHVMTFIGFGLLMTFLKRYGYGAVALNFLLAAIAIEWGTLWFMFYEVINPVSPTNPAPLGAKLPLSIDTLINADFTACTILISFGAVIGKTTPCQLLIMTVIEVMFAKVNEFIGYRILKAADIGGSMFIHTFGAYFGLAVSLVLRPTNLKAIESKNEGTTTVSDIFSMIGTIFLWLYWPSFNAVEDSAAPRYRAVINTYYSLIGSTIIVFALASLLDKKAKFDMVLIQNATLAGGVAMGTAADMILQPWVALVIGTIAGIVSTIGYKFFTPFLNKVGFHDTCGINNLHGMPGIIGACAGILFAGLAYTDNYGLQQYDNFPVRIPVLNSSDFLSQGLNNNSLYSMGGLGRSTSTQSGYQAIALAITLCIAICSGIITGFILRIPIWGSVTDPEDFFNDGFVWNLPENEVAPLMYVTSGSENSPANEHWKASVVPQLVGNGKRHGAGVANGSHVEGESSENGNGSNVDIRGPIVGGNPGQNPNINMNLASSVNQNPYSNSNPVQDSQFGMVEVNHPGMGRMQAQGQNFQATGPL